MDKAEGRWAREAEQGRAELLRVALEPRLEEEGSEEPGAWKRNSPRNREAD